MRETEFIKQNQNKWSEFEQILASKTPNPEKLNDLFVQITDDLSYSRTFYPNRSVRVYLNGLAQKVFFLIYKNRKSHRSRLITFWTQELPMLVHESRAAFQLSFFVFFTSFLIGVLSCAMEPDFAVIILGDSYVDMTMENINSGDPMAVYKQKGAFGFFLGISMNNLYVAFKAFVLGTLFVVGSIAMLLHNGIMLGTFQYFFIEKGLFWESFLSIWIHGTLEISAIIIAGAAGITMGKGLVFPGTYTRLQSFQISARQGLKIMIGTIPLFLFAAFFEAYLTRHTEINDLLRGFFIFACLAFVLGYFGYYSWKIGKKKAKQFSQESLGISSLGIQSMEFLKIKSNSEIFSETFVLFGLQYKNALYSAFFAALFFCIFVFFLAPFSPTSLFSFPYSGIQSFLSIEQFFSARPLKIIPILSILSLSVITWRVFSTTLKTSNGPETKSWIYQLQFFLKSMLGVTAMYCLLWAGEEMAIPLILLGYPIILLWTFIMMEQSTGPVDAIAKTIFFLRRSFGKAIALFAILFVLGIFCFMIIDSSLLWLFMGMIQWVIQFDSATMNEIMVVLMTFLSFFTLGLIYILLLNGTILLYFSLKEISEATTLMSKIESISINKKIRGLDRE